VTETGVLNGPDFSPAASAAYSEWPSQAAEKLAVLPILYRFVTGRDFSRADKANKVMWASVPCGSLFGKVAH
jgi:hypothetical protein